MKKLLHVCTVFLLLFASQVFAQNRTITGTVTAREDGLPLPGVSVRVSGTTTGTVTGPNGIFSISAFSNSSLIFTFIGYDTQTITVGNKSTISVTLESSTKQLREVQVTTALGIKRQPSELGYSTTRIASQDLTQSNPVNLVNGLTAKVAGLNVTTANNGIDPGNNFRLTLRGTRSLAGNNTALLVVDGVPTPNGVFGALNPNDIEDITILNGAGAAALYGSEASNGAIVVTTKKGATRESKPIITYGNSLQFQRAAFYPKFQNNYGSYGGEGAPYLDPLTGFPLYTSYENQQYGPAYNGQMVQVGAPAGSATGPVLTVPYSKQAKDQRLAFFQTGLTEQNDISFQQGDANNSFYISAQNVYTKGIVPNDTYKRTAVRLSATKTYGIFRVDGSGSYSRQDVSTYGTGYNNNSLLYTALIQWPGFLNIQDFKNSTTGTFSNPSDFFDAYAINPWWIVQNSRINYSRDIFNGNINFKLTPSKWFDATYRISETFGIQQQQTTRAAVNFTSYGISDPQSAGNIPSANPLGVKNTVANYTQFGDGSGSTPYGNSRIQGDALLNFHHTFFNDLKTNLILGNSIWSQKARVIQNSSNSLLIPGFYNIGTISGTAATSEQDYVIRQLAFFGDLSLTYKGFVTLEGTLRNDRDSRLAVARRSFYYPSVKAVFIPTQAFDIFKNSDVFSYIKLYGQYSKVGQISAAPYSIQNTYGVTSGFPYGTIGGLSNGTTLFPPDLKPEIVKELEFGTELSFLNDRINARATYYKQNSTNQTVNINASITSGYTNYLLNIGEVQSSGGEFSLSGDVLTKSKNRFGLRFGGNFSIIDSKVISLLPGISSLSLGNGTYAIVGQPAQVYQGTDLLRDNQGHVIVSATTGLPSVDPTLKSFGRTAPKFILGLNTNLSYKFMNLSAVAEYRAGNVIYNAVGSTLNFGGSSAISASNGRQRFIFPNSVINTGTAAAPVYVPNTTISTNDGNYNFWQSSAYNTANSPFVTSAAFWELREVALAFDLTQFVKPTKFIKGVSFALTGRNLLLFKPTSNQWSVPEFNNSTGNDNGTTSASQLPGTRLYGADLKVTF